MELSENHTEASNPPNPPDTICVLLKEQKREETLYVKIGTALHDFFQANCPRSSGNPIVGAKIDGEEADLWYTLVKDCVLEPLDLTSYAGVRIYERGLVLLLWRTVEDLFPGCSMEVMHSISRGLYCEIRGIQLRHDIVQQLEKNMRRLVVNPEPFDHQEVSLAEAIAIFEERRMLDKARLLKNHPTEKVTIYRCGNTLGSFYGRIVPNTSYLRDFELVYYPPGLILRFPDKESPERVPLFEEQNRLFRVFQEHKKWAAIQEVNDIGELNEMIDNGRISDLIRVAESIQEKKIAQIADRIAQDKDNIRVILIAGPSSSGKTTLSKRLGVQLKVNGITAIPISLDDYFRNRDEILRNENGEQDFESLDAMDVKLLNEHLRQLADGQEVELPSYNFNTGKRREKSSLLFCIGDFKNPSSLVIKLRDAADPISLYLYQSFSPNFQQKLSSKEPIDEAFLSDFLKEINRLLTTLSLYEEKRFATILLSKETQDLLKQNPKGYALVRLNRLLLEDAYPQEIAKNPEKKHSLQIKPGQVFILEGINALNRQLTPLIHELQKFKIYISPLTVLNIDSYNRIPTTDLRLIRRIVRDYKFRNYSVRETLSRWPSVRRGDFHYIFPFQNQADVMFNSALIYELAALKPWAVPLLRNVPTGAPEYSEAQRLLVFLSYFHELPVEKIKEIPPTSILREFIGDSSFKY